MNFASISPFPSGQELVVFAVIREYDETNIQLGINGRIAVIKNRYYPDLSSCNIHFDKETGMLAELSNGNCFLYKFSWEQYLSKEFRDFVNPQWVQEAIATSPEIPEECPF